MAQMVRARVRVGRGGRVEVRAPELAEGTLADVIVTPAPEGLTGGTRLADLVGAGAGCYPRPADVDAFLRQLRDEWD